MELYRRRGAWPRAGCRATRRYRSRFHSRSWLRYGEWRKRLRRWSTRRGVKLGHASLVFFFFVFFTCTLGGLLVCLFFFVCLWAGGLLLKKPALWSLAFSRELACRTWYTVLVGRLLDGHGHMLLQAQIIYVPPTPTLSLHKYHNFALCRAHNGHPLSPSPPPPLSPLTRSSPLLVYLSLSRFPCPLPLLFSTFICRSDCPATYMRS